MEINDDFWRFVEENLSCDPSKLRLKYHGKRIEGFDIELAITQIECRRKFGKKLAETLAEVTRLLFPSVLAGEQATSDVLARYHASLIPADSKIVADLTAGMGIDVLHLSSRSEKVVAVEIDHARAEALRYNVQQADARVDVVEGDCTAFIDGWDGQVFDAMFIDPARRSEDGGRVFALQDCRPNVVAMMPRLTQITHKVIVKMSPMLDVAAVISLLPHVSRIIALGTPTECRELVAVIDFADDVRQTDIEAVTLTAQSVSTFTTSREREALVSCQYGVPAKNDTIIEPYPAVMKTGCLKSFADDYGLNKLAPNSNVFFTKVSDTDIPGRCLKVVDVLPYASGIIKRLHRSHPVMEIVCRNFDITPEALRKKLGVKEGADKRLIATKDVNDRPIMIMCEPF